ncbi:MAG: hypothetical protein ACK4S4_02120 [Pyrinomonadaceae bacterium]
MIQEIEHSDFGPSLRLANGDAELIVPTSFGPRILHYAFDGGDNVLGWHPHAAVETELGEWRPYGGHRLWLAPENFPLSYAPDGDAIEYAIEGESSVRLTRLSDAAGVQKEIVVTLADAGTEVTIDNRLTATRSDEPAEFAAWALTIMRPGGEAVVPNEPFAPYGRDTLLPVRSMALWSYTDLTDPRWSIDKDHIELRCDESIGSQQKFGVLNTRGWAAYRLPDVTFVKRYDYLEGAPYPDMNSNTEVYTAGGFVELETLSPLVKAEPGKTIVHRETWELRTGDAVAELLSENV